MPAHPPSRSQVLDHLGLVAGMCDELGMGDLLDPATQQNPERRDLTGGEAVKAMGLNGLGFSHQALSLVPRLFQNKPTFRLIAPRVAPQQLTDDALGRALDTLYAYRVTDLSSLIAATAANRLCLCPTSRHLDRTRLHVAGRYNSAEPPAEQVVPMTQGSSRAHRPALTQGMLDLLVEPQAGMPVLMPPLSGNRSDGTAFGQIVRAHISQWHTTYGTTSLGAERALDSEANLQKLAETHIKWITRVPATLSDVQAALAPVDGHTMAPLTAGSRYHVLPATYGGVEQRWLLIDSEHRQAQAQRTVDKHLLKQRTQEGHAFKTLSRTPFACEADARQALATFRAGWQATFLPEGAVHPPPPYGKRGRPSHGAPPDQGVYHIEGALASQGAVRQALVEQHRCFILATNARDEAQLSPQAVLDGDKGQGHAERGCRFLKDPQFFASSL